MKTTAQPTAYTAADQRAAEAAALTDPNCAATNHTPANVAIPKPAAAGNVIRSHSETVSAARIAASAIHPNPPALVAVPASAAGRSASSVANPSSQPTCGTAIKNAS